MTLANARNNERRGRSRAPHNRGSAMYQRLILIPALMLFTACASTHKPAPGTAPGDMSAAEHREEAAEHEDEAALHQHRADQSNKITEEVEHEKEAAEHEDVAGQHEKAAEEAE